MPEISIVTPSFNQARFIEDCLRSVRQQNYPSIEHIVVDGASTDGTVELLKKYSALPGWEHLRWISEPDEGQSDALNKALKMAVGQVVGWLNSDDTYEQNAFASVMKTFQSDKSTDFVYGDYRIIDSNGRILLLKKEIAFDWNILLCGVNYLAQPNVFFRRSVLDALGYLDVNLRYVMDYELWLRAAYKGYRFKHIPLTLACCRWHLDAKTVLRDPKAVSEIKLLRTKYWDKSHFGHALTDSIYHTCWNIYARVLRQWRKLRYRHTIDIVPMSWYLDLWKMRAKANRELG